MPFLKAKANVLLQVVNEAQLAGDIATAKHSLLQAIALAPGSPQAHKVCITGRSSVVVAAAVAR